jgi:hypothetical protein
MRPPRWRLGPVVCIGPLGLDLFFTFDTARTYHHRSHPLPVAHEIPDSLVPPKKMAYVFASRVWSWNNGYLRDRERNSFQKPWRAALDTVTNTEARCRADHSVALQEKATTTAGYVVSSWSNGASPDAIRRTVTQAERPVATTRPKRSPVANPPRKAGRITHHGRENACDDQASGPLATVQKPVAFSERVVPW